MRLGKKEGSTRGAGGGGVHVTLRGLDVWAHPEKVTRTETLEEGRE